MLPETSIRPCLPRLVSNEFRYINRYWDASNRAFAAKLTPGEYYVSAAGELVTTVLGSCISVCIRDKEQGIGGMNHFMLPMVDESRNGWDSKLLSTAARYGNVAMERLINTILVNGGKRERLECKVFGGARVLNLDSDVGSKNIAFITEYLRVEKLELAAHDLGGQWPRKIIYFPETGVVRLKKLMRISGSTLQARERAYSRRLQEHPFTSDVTIFHHD